MSKKKQGLGVAKYADGGVVDKPSSDLGDPTDDNGNPQASLSDDQPRLKPYVYDINKVYDELVNDLNAPELQHKAFGGSAMEESRMASGSLRNIQQQANHVGPINSTVAGRTDHIPLNVASGSYVIPADIVSGMGQGNTAAGHQIIGKLFGAAPYGGKSAPIRASGPPKMKFADGGLAPEEPVASVPIMAAGGEHVLAPDHVEMVGGGDLDHGHEILDAWVKHERKRINKEQKKLPGPARD